MNVSELIAELAAIQAEHGDMEVFVSQDGDPRHPAVNCLVVDNGEAPPFLFTSIEGCLHATTQAGMLLRASRRLLLLSRRLGVSDLSPQAPVSKENRRISSRQRMAKKTIPVTFLMAHENGTWDTETFPVPSAVLASSRDVAGALLGWAQHRILTQTQYRRIVLAVPYSTPEET